MKRVILLCAVFAAFTASAGAQGVGFGVQGDFVNFNLGVAQTNVQIPTGGGASISVDYSSLFKQVYGLGYGGGAHLDVNLGLIAFRLSGDYIMLSPDKTKYQTLLGSAFTVDGGRIDIYSGNVNLKFTLLPLPVIHVYATGGAGIVELKMNNASLTYNGIPLPFTIKGFDTQTKPTLNAGAGVDLKFGPVALFAELKVNFIMTTGKTSSEVPLATVGITF